MIEQDSVTIPALVVGGRIAIPEMRFGKYLECADGSRENGSSCFQYQRISPPTLAEIMYAFYGAAGYMEVEAVGEGTFSIGFADTGSDEYRKNVFLSDGEGEWTSTFVQNRIKKRGEVVPNGYRPVRIINRPDRIFFDEKREIWIVKCINPERIFDVLEPPEKWITEYDLRTGYPTKTSRNRSDAEKVFGDDASLFFRSDNKLRGVFRKTDIEKGKGPFCICAISQPSVRYSHIEARWSREERYGSETPGKIMTVRRLIKKASTPAVYDRCFLSFEGVPQVMTGEWLEDFWRAIEADHGHS